MFVRELNIVTLSIFTTPEEVFSQEILVFTLNQQWYGLNVLKIKEIIRPMPIHPSPNQHTIVEGVIRLREQGIPVLNTYKLLQVEEEKANYFIIVEHGKKTFALKATDVSKIEQIQAKDMYVPADLSQDKDAFVSSVVTFKDDDILYLFDVERVIHGIHPTHFEDDFSQKQRPERKTYSLMLIEDSQTMQVITSEALQDAGYNNISIYENGEEALRALEKSPDRIHLCITDIDMPILNGLDFTKKIRERETTNRLPIISYSSLHATVMERKGKQVGVDAHVEKPNIKELLQTIDSLLLKG